MADSNRDDETGKPSFGWLFSTITAFGLLLFLAVSFAFYHRRLMVRRKKEAEYNRFFRFLRPDLELFDKKITRARSILTNTHSVDSSFMNVDAEKYNEGFGEDERIIDREQDNENKHTISYADWVGKKQDESVEKNDYDVYLQSVVARKQVLLADMHSDAIFKEPDEFKKDESKLTKASKADNVVDYKYSNMPSNYGELSNFEPIRQSGQYVISQSKDVTIQNVDRKSNNSSEIVKNKSLLKPLKRKKKKLGLQSYIFKKSATSLDEDRIDTSLFYNEPRRSSEPSLFLYNQEVADPETFKSYKNENQISLNPYYTDASIPLNKVLRRPKSTNTSNDETSDERSNSLDHKLSLPSGEEESQVPASTWM